MNEISICSFMKVLAFDLGDTLVEYEGLPPSWEAHYPEALTRLAEFLAVNVTPAKIEAASAVLRMYNTRLNPREQEVPFSIILGEILTCLEAGSRNELNCAVAFFSIFRRRLRCFPDTVEALRTAKAKGLRIGVVTDVPYGMPNELILQDMDLAGLKGLIDDVVTSRDTGVRKPAPGGLAALASKAQCSPQDMSYIGNEKKDIQAALAFGCEAVLLDRSGANPNWRQHRTIRSLAEL
jgi:putative hydrolase of the HAD superfamily